MSCWRYTHCGLRVASDVRLPELGPGERVAATVEPDVRIVLDRGSPEIVQEHAFVTAVGRCRFQAPEAGRYDVREGIEIVVSPAAEASPQMVRLFLLGSAWGALLHQRGALALHGAAVAAGDEAVAFCGPPSAGKSSTVAWLARRGHILLSDDLCRVDVPPVEPPCLWPSTSRLKLSRAALESTGWSAAALDHELPREKFYLPLAGPQAGEPRPLRAVYVLTWGEPGVSRLLGITALRRFLAAATFRPELLEPPGELTRYWERCAEIVRRVPIWELSRPRDWRALDRVMDRLGDGLAPAG